MAEATEFERDLRLLETELRRLELEYNMFFSGQLPKPPLETRGRVEALIRRYDRAHIPRYADRFRFSTLQSRYAVFADLWDRGLRAREEGRPGPFFKPSEGDPQKADARRPDNRIVHVTTVVDPVAEIGKLEQLYERLVDAGREVGQEAFPFHKFVQLVRDQVQELQQAGNREIAFRVALRDGRVTFTARGLKDT